MTCLLLLTALLSSCATLSTHNESTVQKVADHLTFLKKKTSKDSLWSPHLFLDKSILFLSEKNQVLYLIKKGSFEELDYKAFKSKLPHVFSSFDFKDFQAEKILIINLDKNQTLSVEELTALILHESFHFYIQTKELGWEMHQSTQLRGDLYPLQSIPRYFRIEMYRSLMRYLETDQKKQSLESFSYWYQKWKHSFPEEFQNYTDRVEGSAEYFSNQYLTILNNKVSAKTQSPFEYHKSQHSESDLKTELSLTVESYRLGVLSGIILDSINKSWKDKVNKGQSSLEYLASLYQPKKQPTNNTLQKELLHISIQKMQKLDKEGVLDQVIKKLSQTQTKLLVIPMKNINVSGFTTSGIYRSFFNFKILKDLQFAPLLTPLTVSSKDWLIKIDKGKVWVTASQHPCRPNALATVIPLPNNKFHFANGILHVQNSHPYKVKAYGLKDRRIFCAQNQ